MGKEGGQQIEVNSRGQQVRLLGTKEAQDGEDVQISIDQRIQTIAADLLSEHNGSIIVMDLESGETIRKINTNVSKDAPTFKFRCSPDGLRIIRC